MAKAKSDAQKLPKKYVMFDSEKHSTVFAHEPRSGIQVKLPEKDFHPKKLIGTVGDTLIHLICARNIDQVI